MSERHAILDAYVWNHATLLVLELDASGVIQAANPYACHLLGAGCVGQPLTDVLVNFRRDFTLERLRDTAAAPVRLSFTTVSRMPESFLVRFYPTSGGGILVGEYDFAELHELRTMMVGLNGELDNLTRDLQKKNAELQALNIQKNQFLGMAAHDLRNPIATIISYTSLFLDGNLPTDLDKAMHDLHSLAEFMFELVTRLLDLVVIEMGQLTLEKEALALAPFIQDTVELNGMLSRKKEVTLAWRGENLPATLTCDRHKLKQVLNNLLSNAVKFSPPAGRVELTVHRDGDALQFAVTDQGPGIPVAEQERLFKPFGRAQKHAPGNEPSTGLGLAISRRIVEAHGGHIGVTSTPGTGATFWFSLPINTTSEGDA